MRGFRSTGLVAIERARRGVPSLQGSAAGRIRIAAHVYTGFPFREEGENEQ
jgi:hypothetical protein